MRVRMLTAIAGADISASYGEEIDVDDADGNRLVAGGLAEPVTPAKKPAKKKATAKK